MIIRSGLASSHLVMFESGLPDGAVAWSLGTPSGTAVASGTVTPDAGAVSLNLPISGANNTLSVGQYFGGRVLTWSYTVDSAPVGGEFRYAIEGSIPLAATHDGVRGKLGVSAVELPDELLSLAEAYLRVRNADDDSAVTPLLVGGLSEIKLKNAVEAMAGLLVLPTLMVRVASAEVSGTNQFKRQTIDWGAIARALEGMVGEAQLLLDPTFDPVADLGDLFLVVPQVTDAYTGATG